MTATISTVRLIDLSALEVHKLYKLRVDIFVHEQSTPYPEFDDLDPQNSTWHVVAVENHEVLGCARIHPIAAGAGAKIGRFAVLPAYRGTGLAAKIMDAAIEKAREIAPTGEVRLDAQLPLVDYYATFGFSPDGEQYDDTGVLHQPLKLN